MSKSTAMQCIQDLDTSGARATETFTHQGVRYLVVPQLALDVPGQPALMTVGDSDCDALVFRWQGDQHGGQFVRHTSLPVPGGEDAEFFTIGERAFLATASLKTGAGPYELNVFSTVFELDNGVFTRFQDFPTFAAKQWAHFAIGQRHFLALAQGVVMDGLVARHPAKSTIFEWSGERFVEFQQITSAWGYNWAFFEHAGSYFLAHADHIEKSCILRWNGERFEPFQELDGKTGRAFQFFRAEGQAWLAFACLHADTVLYRWDGQHFALHQTLSGPGGREFTWLDDAAGGQLVLVNFLHGTREEPITALQSATYRFQNGQLAMISEFPTLGGTDAMAFEEQGETYLVVAHSLSAGVRFRTPSKVYKLDKPDRLEQAGHGRRAGPPQARPGPLGGQGGHEVPTMGASLPPPKTTMTQEYQSPEFMRLFETYTAGPTSIGSKMTQVVADAAPDAPLIVATAADFVLYPGGGKPPEVVGYRLSTRGFKELAAVSHFGPALASLVKIRELDPQGSLWRSETERLLAATVAAREANSVELWRDFIAVPAYRGRETAIANMVHYACELTERYIHRALREPDSFTASDLRTHYLEATGKAVGATVPLNQVMIATFFLVGLDTSHRVIGWFNHHAIDWAHAMVLIVGRQGRPTAGVTWTTNAVCSMILAASHYQLSVERVYIAPHAPSFQIAHPVVDLAPVQAQEEPMRKLWWYTRAMSDLGPLMYEGYPRYSPGKASRPRLTPETTEVSEMPEIQGPDDWQALNTRMRVILEDPRQLLAGCVTDYAADQLQGNGNDPQKAVVPGLDGTPYPAHFS